MKDFNALNLLLIFLICVLTEEVSNNNELGIKFGNNVPRNLEKLNFIKVTYKEKAEYQNGFLNQYRSDINYIKLGDKKYNANEGLTIEANETIEIYFASPIQILNCFFGYIDFLKAGDENGKKIISVDFTNFDSSAVTQIDYMFSGCNALEKINFTNFRTAGVQSMSHVFEECNALKEIDLSNIIKKNVTDISFLFKGCTSLEFLDLSQFDVANIKNAHFAFDKLNNLKYINLYDVQNSNDIFKNEIIQRINNKNITACQKEIILNETENKCCYHYMETHKCLPFPTYIPEIKSPKTISSALKSTSLTSKTPIFRKASNENKVQVVVLGYNNFKVSKGLISFYTNFVPIQNKLYSQEIRFPITIYYNKNSMADKETEANCTLQKSNYKSKVIYYCEAREDTTNIKEVKVENSFNFISQNNVDIIGISPIARQNLNNIQLLDEKHESIDNSYVYVMDHSSLIKKNYDSFVIYGVINGLRPRFTDKDLIVKINPNSDEKLDIEVKCFFSKVLGTQYSLHCEAFDDFDGYLQSAISYIDNGDLLLINFDNEAQSYINIDNVLNNDVMYSKTCPKCSNSIKPWLMAFIIGLPILAGLTCCFCLFLFLCLRRSHRRPKQLEEVESTIKNLKDEK